MAKGGYKVKVYLPGMVDRTKGRPPVKVTRWTYMLANAREQVGTLKTATGETPVYRYYGRYVNGSQWRLREIEAFVDDLKLTVFTSRYKVHERAINEVLKQEDNYNE